MSTKLTVVVTKGFPLYDHHSEVKITNRPTEVVDSEWLQAQIKFGLVAVVDSQAAKSKSSPAEGEQPKRTQTSKK